MKGELVRRGILGLLLCLLLAPAPAAALEFTPGSVKVEAVDATGQPDRRAGAHPDRFNIGFQLSSETSEPEDVKDVIVDLPAGLSGDIAATPRCPGEAFGEAPYILEACKAENMIGMLVRGNETSLIASVEPAADQIALFGVTPLGAFVAQKLYGFLRPGDGGLSFRIGDIGQPTTLAEPFRGATIELWGVPADHQAGTDIPRLPLLSLPTRCDTAPPSITVRTHTWQDPERWIVASADTGHRLSGCDQLPFDPRADFALDNPRADAPTGAGFEIAIPQTSDPGGRASSQLKEATVTLPQGVGISPGGAEGLRTCSDAQFGLGAAGEPSCPLSSRIGAVEVITSKAARPLRGRIFLGESRPGDRFRLLVAAEGSGAELKLSGSLKPDPITGRLTTTLMDLPQVTFERMRLAFDGGAGAFLATPQSCGVATAEAGFIPFSGTAPVRKPATVAIAGPGGGACGPTPFAPSLTAGSTNTTAGKATTFTATVSRRDGEGLPDRLEVVFPTGMSAAVGTVDPCASAAADSGACPASSRIGSAMAELGPGPNPALMKGEVYLTGPYKKTPFGLALVFHTAIGPFDLGTMAIRAALSADSQTGQVKVLTETLPTSLEGLPIRFQTIGLDIDRPGFMHNPTACSPASVRASLRSVDGAKAGAASPFKVRRCIDLPFQPAFKLSLRGKAQQRSGGRPGLRIAAKIPAGNSNMAQAVVGIPKLLKLDAAKLGAICTRLDALAASCPKASRVGSASAKTPMLKSGLEGSIYAVRPRRNDASPDIWTMLEGEGMQVTFKGETRTLKGGQVQTRLVDLPDFTISSFAMEFAGGKQGVFKLRGNPCGAKARRGLLAPLQIEGQGGMSVETRVSTRTGCG